MNAYFYCVPSEGRAEVPYQHLAVCLAEGLRALGVRCYGNAAYWPLDAERSDFLVEHDPAVAPADCALLVVSDDWYVTGNALPPLPRAHDACVVVLDREDGARLHTLAPAFRNVDFVLRTHYNRDTRYGANFVPWAYGLSARIIAATGGSGDARRWSLLANWRHTHNPHSLRLAVERRLLPQLGAVLPIERAREEQSAPPAGAQDRVWWRETGRRHWPAYYARLRAHAVCACFGGYFVTARPRAKESILSRGLKRALTLANAHTYLISQWDSWRLWEALGAGCAALHVDLERYGCVLPEMPVNGEHYLGVDLERPQGTLDLLRDDRERVARIARAGRTWAYAHYGPEPVARRLLTMAGLAA